MKKNFHLAEVALQALSRNGQEEPTSARLNAVMDRYDLMLSSVTPPLSEAELMATIEAHWSHAFTVASLDVDLWMNVEDALGDGLAEKHEIDGAALVAKLAGLTNVERIWLIEEIERRRNLS